MSDPDTTGPGTTGPGTPGPDDDLGADDPITGVTAARTDLDDTGTDEPSDAPDPLEVRAQSRTTVTNDAVAGETVLPGTGDGNDGPTGGSLGEIQPILPDNDLAGEDIDLDDEA
jgi:hypothetical protein